MKNIFKLHKTGVDQMIEDMAEKGFVGVVSLTRSKEGELELWIGGKFNRLETLGALQFIIDDIVNGKDEPAYIVPEIKDGQISSDSDRSE